MDVIAELLTASDPPPVEHVNPLGKAPVLVTCDHASRRVPKSLRNLGLGAESLKLHIGWDIGAADVSRGLARRLDAPAILAGYSRLVIDCNRDLDDPTSIPAVSDGTPVPGNQDLSPAAKGRRVEALFRPYHLEVEAALDGFAARGVHPAVLSIHSFTPVMNDFERPWHIGILWDKDPRMPVPVLAALRREPGLVVGDNEPYSAREPAGYTAGFAPSRGRDPPGLDRDPRRHGRVGRSPGAGADADPGGPGPLPIKAVLTPRHAACEAPYRTE
jgi:predicted N-formylglutamate amidohydrolase